MAITAAMVKELREKTNAGMMDCKTALSENNGDMDAAVDWLRKKGLSSAAKKSGRVASEGLISVATSGTRASIIELNAETDFVSRNAQFQKLVGAVTQKALELDCDTESLKDATLEGKTIQETITDLIASIGENMSLRRATTLSVTEGVVCEYIHGSIVPNMGKIGVLVALESTGDQAKLTELGSQIAMHIAATRPESLNIESLDQSKVEREREVLIDQAKDSGKPAEIIEKMIEGRIRKFYQEVVLLEQTFIMDNERTIKKVLEDAAKDIGAPVTLTAYERYELGEGIEKKEDNFADEVAKMAG